LWLAAVGEAVGILIGRGGASVTVWVLSIIALLMLSSVLLTVWYILQKYVASRGDFGLHYFVGAADTNAFESSTTQVQCCF
jgi:hypothetical protein